MSTQPERKSTKLTHTPGPWNWNDGDEVITAEDGKVYVAWLPSAPSVRGTRMVKCDARLIAAAPDFYREAIRVVEWLDRLAARADELAKDTRFMTLAQANGADAKNYRASAKGLRAAIAKAEGR